MNDEQDHYHKMREGWEPTPTYFMSELGHLQITLEASIKLLEEQISALFQITTKLLTDSYELVDRMNDIEQITQENCRDIKMIKARSNE